MKKKLAYLGTNDEMILFDDMYSSLLMIKATLGGAAHILMKIIDDVDLSDEQGDVIEMIICALESTKDKADALLPADTKLKIDYIVGGAA